MTSFFRHQLITLNRSLTSTKRHLSNLYMKNVPKQSQNQNDNNEIILQQIQEEFYKYPGGSIDLTKNESNGMATICLNHPQRKNSFSGAMMAQFRDVLINLQNWKQGKCVLIYGADNFFCSGGDLNTVRKIANYSLGKKMSLLMHDNWFKLQSLPMITVALIQGSALGGGAELITACDFRLMTNTAKIGYVHIKLGITSAWGGGTRLCYIVGTTQALKLMSTGQTISAEQALNIGLVDEILYHDEKAFQDAHHWISNQFLNHNSDALKATKAIVNQSKLLPLQLSLQNELEYSCSLWGGQGHIKALKSNIKHK